MEISTVGKAQDYKQKKSALQFTSSEFVLDLIQFWQIRRNYLFKEKLKRSWSTFPQITKNVRIEQLSTFAGDLGISQTQYQRITAPNMYTQAERIGKVSS